MGVVLEEFSIGRKKGETYFMRTTGKRPTIETHVKNKPNGKIKESQKERILKMRALKKENHGVVTSYAIDHERMPRPKEIRVNELGVAQIRAGGAVYDPQRFPHIAEVLCREYGFLAVQLAEVLGVSKTSIDKWIQIHPEFKAAVYRGREEFDTGKVEQSLLKRALGYEYTEKTERTVFLIGKNKFTDVEVAVPAREIVTTTKALPADVKAIMFWLQNRQPGRWKSVAYIQAQMNQNKTVTHVNVDADLENMSVEQIKALRAMVEVSNGSGKQQEAIEISNEEVGNIIHRVGQKMLGCEDAIEDYDLEN